MRHGPVDAFQLVCLVEPQLSAETQILQRHGRVDDHLSSGEELEKASSALNVRGNESVQLGAHGQHWPTLTQQATQSPTLPRCVHAQVHEQMLHGHRLRSNKILFRRAIVAQIVPRNLWKN